MNNINFGIDIYAPVPGITWYQMKTYKVCGIAYPCGIICYRFIFHFNSLKQPLFLTHRCQCWMNSMNEICLLEGEIRATHTVYMGLPSTLSGLVDSAVEGRAVQKHRHPRPGAHPIGGAGCQSRRVLFGGVQWLVYRVCVCRQRSLSVWMCWGLEGIISMDHLSRWLPTQQRRTQDGVSTCWISGSPRLRLS